MKLQPRDAPGYFARAEPPRPGLLIYGEDAMRVALKRQEVILAMIGAQGESEMRLTRIDGADARKDPALVGDAMKATGFFPGPRAVLVDEATDSLTDAVAAALDDWREGDACLVVTAGKQLPPSSRLRKLFEARPDVWCAAIYNDPPSRAEIETVLKRAGAGEITREGMAEIEALSRALDPGDFRQTIEKLALYKHGDPTPVTPDDVAAAAPTSTEADVDAVLDVVAEAQAQEIGPLLRRLEAQGITPVGLCIAASRHFRALHAAAADPEGPAKAFARRRMNFKRRDRMVRQAQSWGTAKAGEAVHLLTDTDLALRSSARMPEMALVERTLIRLAMLGRR
jgi:DNA polymerase III subunit delta